MQARDSKIDFTNYCLYHLWSCEIFLTFRFLLTFQYIVAYKDFYKLKDTKKSIATEG